MEEQNRYFPLFVNLRDRDILVFGGGRVAERRIGTILSCFGRVHVVSPALSGKLEELRDSGTIQVSLRPYQEGEIGRPFFVLAATDDKEVNKAIYRECRQKNIPVNLSSDPEKCDFYFPGLAAKGSLVAGVTASGTDHKKAALATRKIQSLLDSDGDL